MPHDNGEDLMPRCAPNPTPLVEVPAKPLVPEVSLLWDQDKNKPLNFRRTSIPQETERNQITNAQGRVHSEVLQGNQFESYSMWKAKNAEPLHAITSSLGMAGLVKKNISSKKPSSIRNNQTVPKELLCSQQTDTIPHNTGSQIQTQIYTTYSKNTTGPELNSNEIGNCAQKAGCNVDQQWSHCVNKPVQDEHCISDTRMQFRDEEILVHMRDKCQISKEPQVAPLPSSPITLHRKQYNPNKLHAQNINCGISGFNESRVSNNSMPDHIVRNYNDSDYIQAQCQCRQNSRSDVNNRIKQVEFVDREPAFVKEGKNGGCMSSNSKVVSPLDLAQINNQAFIDLYNIIHIQNEQILMLQQQVKQVLKIHLDCDIALQRKFTCSNCTCTHKNVQTTGNNTCTEFDNSRNHEDSKEQQKSLPSGINSIEKTKRSIGIMTSPIDSAIDIDSSFIPDAKLNIQTINNKSQKPKKQRELPVKTPYVYHQPNQRKLLHKPGKKEKTTSQRRKNADEVKNCSYVDNSFSLNEAELVIRTAAEQEDDMTPNNSVHVDMQDYYSSSFDSTSRDSEASSSDEDNDKETGNEEESSNPQLGWTFYNQVVGQVNNLLKKGSSRSEHPQMSRRPLTNHVYNFREEQDTENNWSKRVTFDGPPLEESDNNTPNLMHVPRFHHPRSNEDFRGNGIPERRQDFMMYNIADGNTNLSLTTLRYLEHYNLLPPQRGYNITEPMFKSYQTRNKYQKPKKKKPSSDKYSYVPQQIHKRKASTPASKLLDITALKQQPKLF